MQALQSLHTFALPSQCQQLITIEHWQQLLDIDFSQPFCLLGEGSNTVFLDDFAGAVIKVAILGRTIVEHEHNWQVEVGAGENWHALVLHLLDKGIAGLENLALIPGNVGAAPVQNIGAYGVELAQFVDYVEGFNIQTGRIARLTSQQCEFAYRDSVFKHALKGAFVITKVGLTISKHWQPVLGYGPLQQLQSSAPTALQVCDEVIKIRQSKLPDPNELANAGSFFKNPIVAMAQVEKLQQIYPDIPVYPTGDKYGKLAAGWLIEQAGLKGYQIGDIAVYDKQALVLVNKGKGKAKQLKTMVEHIQQQVWAKFAVKLEHEVRLLAHDQEVHLQGVHDE